MSPSPAADAAVSLLAELVASGVRDVVISPGSRSQALALAATHLARQGVIRVHVRIDERVAGFTALGLARETRVPTAVICTSGTAAANLLPATMEAFHSGVPLLLLTADRPPELRGVGANQATIQPGLFDAFVRWQHDAPVPGDGSWDGLATQAVAAAMGADETPAALPGVAGPVHLNLPMREPLSSALPVDFAATAGPAPTPDAGVPLILEREPRTVVVAGADAGPAAEEISHAGSWPLVAEIVSGSRFGRYVVHGYREHLRDESLGGRIERVVVLGHPTLSREVTALLKRDDVDVVAVRSGGEALNLNGRTLAAASVDVGGGDTDRAWLGEWMRASAASVIDLSENAPDQDGLHSNDPAARRDAVRAELDAVRRPLDRELLVDAVWRATWPHDRLMFGSSRLVRVADAVLGGKKVPVHASRGLAGIDGTIATATGIAIASQADGAAGVTRVLLGDLAFLHDVGALLLPPDEQKPRIQVIVGNDGGGTIFDGLEVAASAPRADLDRVFYTPHTAGIEQLAGAYGWDYKRITTRTALDQALTSPVAGPQIIEVPLPR
ncbi:2-succinyl-5-enolpyruvyl-6-hydroxy-3-cyclohexene-1-carboxylic-acid synthase [Microbacterium aerolatum]|uniref:2-succinyl-5-enolpyruvyl-6-hydroxy-3-cyclohexene-1-carboxylate synthase n=1 Tax=Microbacterium aerolatum TaxID=153731 RepID=A0A511AAX5_9MICO|nr:2-succinyl-5-enolpyruvyl-6-hydroxy-3-cyclohexene-1-carboxylic-acid synthase [Microbacterium aerolatum]GEK85338.1 2-succinyl-5-enolpyruvyl-6-hydroxy-3-cyclohexene-1-carboxylate synthase [Microbacterium aerolatum]GGB30334.1 2-succinyl-5-enolpyruvyl-6-hydroxy-3-cyclohexene-1-carboxylate synthase [Microbacterium aerolatum]